LKGGPLLKGKKLKKQSTDISSKRAGEKTYQLQKGEKKGGLRQQEGEPIGGRPSLHIGIHQLGEKY